MATAKPWVQGQVQPCICGAQAMPLWWQTKAQMHHTYSTCMLCYHHRIEPVLGRYAWHATAVAAIETAALPAGVFVQHAACCSL
jgi:hypothetical protein